MGASSGPTSGKLEFQFEILRYPFDGTCYCDVDSLRAFSACKQKRPSLCVHCCYYLCLLTRLRCLSHLAVRMALMVDLLQSLLDQQNHMDSHCIQLAQTALKLSPSP